MSLSRVFILLLLLIIGGINCAPSITCSEHQTQVSDGYLPPSYHYIAGTLCVPSSIDNSTFHSFIIIIIIILLRL